MPTAQMVALADAVKVHVEGGSYSQAPASVTRDYVFVVPENGPTTLQVIVVPAGDEAEIVARSMDKHSIAIDVVVAKQVPAADKATIDALMLFAQEIRDRLRRHSLTIDGKQCTATAANRDPVFDRTLLRERNTFLSVCRMTYFALQS
jgi:hypothetical protein